MGDRVRVGASVEEVTALLDHLAIVPKGTGMALNTATRDAMEKAILARISLHREALSLLKPPVRQGIWKAVPFIPH